MSAELIPLYPGATPTDWQHLDLVLGLTEDLLPVVSNRGAQIAPGSTLKDKGKVPSIYNRRGEVVGLSGWTSRSSSGQQITEWQRQPDYGICVQTRRLRAIDIDISDAGLARQVADAVHAHLGIKLPMRWRSNSAKCLLVFELPGDLGKRKITTAHGIIELLATGQQFIAVGTHPSGTRYVWDEGALPDRVPQITLPQCDSMWDALQAAFGTGESSSSSPSTKAARMHEAIERDPLAQHLIKGGWVKRTERDGRMHIRCPFEAEHTTDTGDSSTTYWPALTGGYLNGHYRCLHGHCDHRTDQDFRDAVGYREVADEEFEAIAESSVDAAPPPDAPGATSAPDFDGPSPITDAPGATPAPALRFPVLRADQFAARPAVPWLIKGLLPKAQLAVVYGASGSGKSFLMLDMLFDLAMGTPWRGMRCAKSRVVYVAAEGAGGVQRRLQALAQARGVSLADVPIGVVADAPNLLEKTDALDLAKAIQAAGGADAIILDTVAQVMPGGNENSAEDMGRVLRHCRGLNVATGALVILIHHPGKDVDRGARGWSGLRGAADTELQVERFDSGRVLTVTKQKDGEDGQEFGFDLRPVLLGLDDDGEEITSCVIEHQVEVPKQSTAPKRRAPGKVEAAVLAAVEHLGGIDGHWVEPEAVVQDAVGRLPAPDGRDKRAIHARRAMASLVRDGHLEESPLGVRCAE